MEHFILSKLFGTFEVLGIISSKSFDTAQSKTGLSSGTDAKRLCANPDGYHDSRILWKNGRPYLLRKIKKINRPEDVK